MLSFCCQFAWPHSCIFVLLILCNFTISTSRSTISYSKHCGSVVPEATPTTYADSTFPYLETLTSFITGGERFFGKNSTYSSYTNLYLNTNVFATNSHGLYKIEAELTFMVVNNEMYDLVSNSTHGRSSPRRRRSGRLMFLLHGFWSESSGKACFVGSAPWYSSIGEPLSLEAMFKINYPKGSTYSNGFLTGELESLSHLDDETYFEPISILSFPYANRYEYTLISEETVKGFYVFDDIKNSLILGSEPVNICSLFDRNYYNFNLEYKSSCSSSLKNCSPLDGVLKNRPKYVSLYSIQCYENGNKMRFLVNLNNRSNGGMYENFDPSAILVGEGLWEERTNSLVIVACRISSSNSFGDARVGDCSIRLSLYYPSVWSIKNRDKAVGQIWTNKTSQDVGYFGIIKFRSSDVDMRVPGVKYGYTEIEKVNKLCPKKAVTWGERYPSGHSHDMRFDMCVQNSKYFGWSSAEPIFIGNESHAYSSEFISVTKQQGDFGEILESEVELENVVSDNVPLNISYKLIFSTTGDFKLEAGHSSLSTSLNSNGQLVISAEGVYDAGTGYLCMVGCRNLLSNNSLDCDIVLNFQFPGSIKAKGGFIKGSMQSTRKQSDPLFFEHLNMTSPSFISSEAQRSIWRIDLEITMVLISNTNVCLFVCFQLYHVKRYPNTVPYLSLVMLVILTLGHMVPLVLNFEALFMAKQYSQNLVPSSSGWLEVNEVIVRVATMAAFLFQFRLLQLAWTARHTAESNDPGISVAEKKTLLVSIPIYIVGGLVAILLSWKKNYYGKASPAMDYSQAQHQQHTLWGDLRSYAGLIVDGFLFPQVLLNIFQMSRRSALSMPFYLGITLVHSVPHAYDLYRANKYVPALVKSPYLYANPSADFYSAAWDIIIPLVGLFLVAIIFLQQRYGGRIILPRKFR
ncbi:Cytidylate kinase [Heracleum sosnowskyi]|uniref:RING-type E3 ubiquitin transferase n=1 Tax=Heracleum sosnowskyi TaxID=360622 RepID=A0AAD8JK02_9APIA|nr:Cytidylate kinase [Heracleum sosnowskyi]